MTKPCRTLIHIVLVALSLQLSWAWVGGDTSNNNQRRNLLKQTLATGSALLLPSAAANAATTAVQTAVGATKAECREAGTCLEQGQLDGVVGWTWGGKDRCDPTDPKCGPDGKLLDEAPRGQPIPTVTNKITHLAEIVLDIGREETVVLHFGLYGEDCPASVKQMLYFLTSGIATTSKLQFENGMGIRSSPVALPQYGKLMDIVPGKLIDFGVESQAIAFGRSQGTRKAGDDFVPQPRPDPTDTKEDAFVRKHDVAGLISIPSKGIGYGGSGFESDDEAYGSAFQITADAVPSLDKANRRVIGQVIDDQSMASLARLASLPTKKGIKGVIPGQTSGPPLLKINIREVEAKKVQT